MTTSHPIRFVSLGPGEPDLITLKGFKALQTADCIFCPATMTATGNLRHGHFPFWILSDSRTPYNVSGFQWTKIGHKL